MLVYCQTNSRFRSFHVCLDSRCIPFKSTIRIKDTKEHPSPKVHSARKSYVHNSYPNMHEKLLEACSLGDP